MLSSVDTHHKHIRSALPGSADFKDAGAVLCSTKKNPAFNRGGCWLGKFRRFSSHDECFRREQEAYIILINARHEVNVIYNFK